MKKEQQIDYACISLKKSDKPSLSKKDKIRAIETH